MLVRALHPTVPEGEALAAVISRFRCQITEERALCVISSYTKAKVQKDLGKPSGLGCSPGKLICPTLGFVVSPHPPQSATAAEAANWNEW